MALRIEKLVAGGTRSLDVSIGRDPCRSVKITGGINQPQTPSPAKPAQSSQPIGSTIVVDVPDPSGRQVAMVVPRNSNRAPMQTNARHCERPQQPAIRIVASARPPT